jgi:CHAT domain-containing protein/tetratricopeptide (TPR) repeat protein
MRRALGFLWLFLLFPALSFCQSDPVSLAKQEVEEAQKLAGEKELRPAIRTMLRALDLYREAATPTYSEQVNLLGTIGRYYRQLGEYDSCYIYLRDGIRLGEEHLTANDATLLANYNSMGIYYYFSSDCDNALLQYEKVLAGRLSNHGRMHEQVANIYSNMAICYEQLGNYKQALQFYQEALAIRTEIMDPSHPSLADSYFNLGTLFNRQGDFDQALEYYEDALQRWENILDPEDPDFGMVYNNMGVCYQDKGDYARAQELLEKALDHNLKSYGSDHPEVANVFTNLGVNYYDYGDYNRALLFYQKALRVRIAHFGEKHHLVARLYNLIGNCYRQQKKYDYAYQYAASALKIRREIFGDQHREVADSYIDLGAYFEEVEEYDEALAQYQKALRILRKQLGRKHPLIADSYQRMGDTYFLQGFYQKAIESYERSLEINREIWGDEHPTISELYTKMAACYPDDPRTALNKVELALQTLGIGSRKTNTLDLRTPLPALNALRVKGEIEVRQFERTGDNRWLEEAENTFLLALRMIHLARRSYLEPSSKRMLLDNFFQIFEQSIAVQYHLYTSDGNINYIQEAFNIAENSKNVLLLEAAQKARAENFSGLPDHLLQRENDLRIDIAYYEQRRFEEESNKNPDKEVLDQTRNQIFELKRAYYSLMDTLETNFPEYYNLRYGAMPISIQDIQTQYLEPGQSLLEYFVGDEHIYLFLINDEQAELLRIQKNFPLETWVRQLRESIFRYNPMANASPSDYEEFANTAFLLYERLLSPLETLMEDSVLTIVPDGALGYLPFECLLTENRAHYRSWKQLPFLIRKYQLSYQYAASLLRDEYQKPAPVFEEDFAGFAPGFGASPNSVSGFNDWRVENLKPLRYNQEEVKRINRLLRGRLFIGEEATEYRFREVAGSVRVIHLATHAQANDTIGAYSYLAFSPNPDSLENELLFVKDLYNMHLPAEMVVLSACETGIGEWQRGEGIISLGRGFQYAGAQSIVTTLWSVDDKPAALIMEKFYRNLKAGMVKDQALREAKLEFIRQNSAVRAHPLYWAAYIPAGSMDAIQWEPSLRVPAYVWLLLGSVLLFVGAVLFLRFYVIRPLKEER